MAHDEWSLPVVAETWDGGLNDINGFHVTKEDAWAAMDSARIFLRDVETVRSEEHTSELQSQSNLVCRLLLEKKNKTSTVATTLSSLARCAITSPPDPASTTLNL